PSALRFAATVPPAPGVHTSLTTAVRGIPVSADASARFGSYLHQRSRQISPITSALRSGNARSISSSVTQRSPKRGKRGSMIPAKVKALAAIGHGAHQDRLMRAKVIARIGARKFFSEVALNWNQIEDGCREVPDLATLLQRDIPGHRECL